MNDVTKKPMVVLVIVIQIDGDGERRSGSGSGGKEASRWSFSKSFLAPVRQCSTARLSRSPYPTVM